MEIDYLKWISLAFNAIGLVTMPLIVYIFRQEKIRLNELLAEERCRTTKLFEKMDEMSAEIDDVRNNYLNRFDNVKEHVSFEVAKLTTSVSTLLERTRNMNN